MPRRPKKKPNLTKTEHLIVQPIIDGKPGSIEYHAIGTSEYIHRKQKEAEQMAETQGVGLRSTRISGKSMVSFSGISQAKWDAIFKKKKRGRGKGK